MKWEHSAQQRINTQTLSNYCSYSKEKTKSIQDPNTRKHGKQELRKAGFRLDYRPAVGAPHRTHFPGLLERGNGTFPVERQCMAHGCQGLSRSASSCRQHSRSHPP